MGWVPQQPYLFPGTVADNIRLGWPEAPDEAVAAAARAAALDDVPLDRRVTERGGGLSSGQRRRVALARALLHGRPVLLLDEPTAGLDPETEERVLDTLRAQAAAGRIVLIAAHHPRVIAAADQVARLTVPEEAPPRQRRRRPPLRRRYRHDDVLAVPATAGGSRWRASPGRWPPCPRSACSPPRPG